MDKYIVSFPRKALSSPCIRRENTAHEDENIPPAKRGKVALNEGFRLGACTGTAEGFEEPIIDTTMPV